MSACHLRSRIILLVALLIILVAPISTTLFATSALPHPEQVSVFGGVLRHWFFEGGFNLEYIFFPHFPHIHAVSKVAVVSMMAVFGVNFVLVSWMSLVLCGFTTVLLCILFSRSMRAHLQVGEYYFFLFCIITICVYQIHFAHPHRLLGFSFGVFFSVAAIYLLSGLRSTPRVVAALCSCILATGSTMFGGCSFLVCTPLLLRESSAKKKLLFIVLFLGMFIACVVMYYILISAPLEHHLGSRTGGITNTISFALVILGMPVFPTYVQTYPLFGVAIGSGVLLALVLCFVRDMRSNSLSLNLPWYCIASFGIGSTILSAVGRGGLTLVFAQRPKFLIFSCLVLLSVYILSLQQQRFRRYIKTMFVLSALSTLAYMQSAEMLWITRYVEASYKHSCFEYLPFETCAPIRNQQTFFRAFPSFLESPFLPLDYDDFHESSESVRGNIRGVEYKRRSVILSGEIFDDMCQKDVEVIVTATGAREVVARMIPHRNTYNRIRSLACIVPRKSFWNVRLQKDTLNRFDREKWILEIWAYLPSKKSVIRLDGALLDPRNRDL